MSNLKCNVCNRIFTGEQAESEIKEHLLHCATSEVPQEEVKSLDERLKEAFPWIKSIEYEDNYDYDEPDCLRIVREDNTSYLVVYDYNEPFATYKKDDPFKIAKNGIESVEALIKNIVSSVKEQVPMSDIHFTGIRENSGYMGNGYHFAITIDDKVETLTYYKNSDHLSKFIEKIISFYKTECSGVLTKLKDEYSVDGVSINQWLLNHVGKEIELKEKK